MNKILIFIFFAILAFTVYWFFFKKENTGNYIDHISMYRHDRAEFFRNSPESPFISQKVQFSYLNYYPANIDFRIEAEFEKNTSMDTIGLATSTGTIDKFVILGTANFELKEEKNSLLILGSINPSDNSLFIPYIDKTSGQTTYGSGRYLDVTYINDKNIMLDFNKSYNPYCAYTDSYTCPFPPKGNMLSIAIEAGEKSFPRY